MNMHQAAQALGRLARGKPKNYSRAELARRRARMIALNQRRKSYAPQSRRAPSRP